MTMDDRMVMIEINESLVREIAAHGPNYPFNAQAVTNCMIWCEDNPEEIMVNRNDLIEVLTHSQHGPGPTKVASAWCRLWEKVK